MGRRRFDRAFKLEAVKLVRDRGVSASQAARDLDVHENVLRKWVKEFAADPQHAFPGQGQMKPEQLEIERLRREVVRLKAERDILKKATAGRRARDRAATRSWVRRCGAVSSPPTGPTAPVGCGTTCWPRASHAACIASSG